jgi:hypothetical protein
MKEKLGVNAPGLCSFRRCEPLMDGGSRRILARCMSLKQQVILFFGSQSSPLTPTVSGCLNLSSYNSLCLCNNLERKKIYFKKALASGCVRADVCLLYQLLRRWRQEDHQFQASPGKVSKILSQK